MRRSASPHDTRTRTRTSPSTLVHTPPGLRARKCADPRRPTTPELALTLTCGPRPFASGLRCQGLRDGPARRPASSASPEQPSPDSLRRTALAGSRNSPRRYSWRPQSPAPKESVPPIFTPHSSCVVSSIEASDAWTCGSSRIWRIVENAAGSPSCTAVIFSIEATNRS